MSTRKLIAAALVCGLAILLAGGVFLVNLAANRDELTVPDILALGQTATVAGVRAAVLDATPGGGDAPILVRVRVAAGDRAVVDAAEGWALVIGSARPPVAAGETAAPGCKGLAVAAGATVECALGFEPADGPGYVEYARGGERARWQLDG